MTLRDQVKEFHDAFGVPSPAKPCVPDEATVRLRLRLIAEEFFELMYECIDDVDALRTDEANVMTDIRMAKLRDSINLTVVADALGDLDYVIEGTRLAFGIDGQPIADAIHAANMRKLGPDGKPIRRADGKVTKPEGWAGPEADIQAALIDQGWEP